MTAVSAAPTATPTAPSAAREDSTPDTPVPLLRIDDLAVAFGRRGGRDGLRVLDGVGLHAAPGEILGLIGETGSGKTTLARAVVGLSPVTAGRITVDGTEVTALRGRALRAFRRGGRVQYLFQDSLRSLDPDLTVRRLVAEPLAVAGEGTREQRAERADAALRQVGLDPDALGGRLPGRLSGGQRQRVAVARAVVTRPRLLLADEPVSALDASNRNHVLRLLDQLRRELGLTIVVISHDLSSLAGIADRLAVLYRGRLVEQGPTAEVLNHPLHPYTALLAASAPSLRAEHGPSPADLRTPALRPGSAAGVGAESESAVGGGSGSGPVGGVGAKAGTTVGSGAGLGASAGAVAGAALGSRSESAVGIAGGAGEADADGAGDASARPRLLAFPASGAVRGCRYASRCRFADDMCREAEPEPGVRPGGREVACHHADTWRALLPPSASVAAPAPAVVPVGPDRSVP